MKRHFCLVTLGCPKNLIDSEEMAWLLCERGYEPVPDPRDANFLILNTCSFIREAVEETIDHILELEKIKAKNPNTRVVVTGCFVQRYGKKLPALFPTVDVFLGTGCFNRIITALEELENQGNRVFEINRPAHKLLENKSRILSTPRHVAYLKVAEGCSNRCSFCLIPALRGPLRSRPVEAVVREARELTKMGVREIILVAQDTTVYGYDLEGRALLPRLLSELGNIASLQWIRLMYAHPSRISDDLLRVIRDVPNVLPYLDIPMQHVVPGILDTMNRKYEETPERVVERIRTVLPDAVLRTSLMVGFPGETTRDFRRLLRFVERVQFDRLGVFGFSSEPGTAAYHKKPKVRLKTIARRKDEIMVLQADISFRKHQALLGTVQEAVVEKESANGTRAGGRLWSQAPEIDGECAIRGKNLKQGQIVPVRIMKADTYDFQGEICR